MTPEELEKIKDIAVGCRDAMFEAAKIPGANDESCFRAGWKKAKEMLKADESITKENLIGLAAKQIAFNTVKTLEAMAEIEGAEQNRPGDVGGGGWDKIDRK